MFPVIKINLRNIKKNAEYLKSLCAQKGVEVAAVTKVVCGNPDIAKEILNAGIPMLADARMQNIIKLRNAGIEVPLMLVRIPMLTEIPQLVDYVDYCLVSENTVLKNIIEKKGKRNTKFVFMIDVGDLREGVWFENAYEEIDKAIDIAGKRLV